MAETSKEHSERQSTQFSQSKITTINTFVYVLRVWSEVNCQIFSSKLHGIFSLIFVWRKYLQIQEVERKRFKLPVL